MTFYRFASGRVNHVFCNTCGCQLYETLDGEPDWEDAYEGKNGQPRYRFWVKVMAGVYMGGGVRGGVGPGRGGGRVDVQGGMVDVEPKFRIRL